MASAPSSRPTPAPLRAARVVVGAMMVALVVFGVVARLIMGSAWPEQAWVWITVLLVVAIGGVLAATLGLRVRPIPAGTHPAEVRRLAGDALTSTTMLRAALTEAPAIVAFALAFLVDAWVVYAVGGAMSLVLMAVLAWPSATVLHRLAAALDAEGARSGLAELA